MKFGWSEEDVRFRKDLRSFVETELNDAWDGPTGRLGSDDNVAFSKQFAPRLAEKGWLTPHWPAEHGGRGASPWQHIILGEEMWSIGEPRGPQYMNVNWIGPSIMAHGTEEQQRQHLPPIARGEVIWCQGFSEPEAGSDLAALRTRAELDGDEYVVNGQKIWTSYASVADYCYLLVRTGPDDERHAISVLLVPTDAPGFEIRKIGAVVGESAFHELFFTDMRVPVSWRLGPENEGWKVVREALAFERVGAPRYARAAYLLDRVADWARDEDLLHDDGVAKRLGETRARCEAARMLVYQVISERAARLPPTPNAYLARAAMVQAERAVGELAMDLMGAEGLEHDSLADEQLRKSMTAGIAAGAYEIQLNLIARLVLELPKG